MKDHLVIYRRQHIRSQIAFRPGESKLGEHLRFLAAGATRLTLRSYAQKGIKFVLLGIPESIGILANMGKCCTENAWPLFLKHFLNIQSNRFLRGNDILCLGHIDTQDLSQAAASLNRSGPEALQKMRALCSRLDDRVYPVIEKIVSAGIIPLVVGGGHNNAYPIIKGTARALGATDGINCINCDPHADYRPMEGRHSGNSFTYAAAEGHLSRYFVFGLHASYNSEAALEALDRNEHAAYCRFEPHADLRKSIKQAVDFIKKSNHPVGIELDLDSIADMPSSFATPSGLSVEDARFFICEMTSKLRPAYLHLPEAAPVLDGSEAGRVGKTLAYLVADFIKTFQRKNKG